MPDLTRRDEDVALFSAVRRAFSSYHAEWDEAGPRPERHSSAPKRRLLTASVAGLPLAAVAVVAVVVLVNLTTPPSAFAGWTAIPSPAVATSLLSFGSRASGDGWPPTRMGKLPHAPAQ